MPSLIPCRALGSLTTLGVLALAVSAPSARASTATFNTAQSPFTTGYNNEGYYYSYGDHDNTNNNFFVGKLGTGNPTHDFFTFDLSGLDLTSQVVTGATLTIDDTQTLGASASGLTDQTLNLYSVATSADVLNAPHNGTLPGGSRVDIYNDLGDGSVFAQAPIPINNSGGSPEVISLDNAALTDISDHVGSFFSIGGTLTIDPASTGDEYLFGGGTRPGSDPTGLPGTNIGGPQVLTLTLAPKVNTAVPEPAPLALLGMGLLPLGLIVRKKITL